MVKKKQEIEIIIDDEFNNLIPPLSNAEFNGLKKSIIAEGCRDPLVLWDNILLDGHNRYHICMDNGILFKRVVKNMDSREDAMVWIIKNQFGRRNLTDGWKLDLKKHEKEILLKKGLKKKIEEGKKTGRGHKKVLSENDNTFKHNTREIIAEELGWSTGKVAEAEIVQRDNPVIWEDVKTGDKSVHEAYKEVKRQERKEKRKESIDSPNLPDGIFDIIYADPPWKYDFSETASREIEKNYPTMNLDKLKNKLKEDKFKVADNAVLFMWATAPKIREALQVMEAWGFEYKTNLVWVKDKIGMGYHARGRHELLFVGTKGNGKLPAVTEKWESVIIASRGEHSKKPEIVYTILEAAYPECSYLELFARNKQPGWEAWGLEVK